MKKNLFLLLSGLLVASLIIFSCKKDDDEEEAQAITEQEAADVVGGSVAGMNTYTTAATTSFAGLALKAGQADWCSYVDTFSATYNFDVLNRSYDYSYSCEFGITCTGLIPTEYYFTFEADASYSGPHYSSEGTADGDWVLGDILSTGTTYDFSGTYIHSGTHTLSQYDLTVTGSVEIDYSDFEINKLTGTLESGTATVTIKGTTSEGGSYEYSGSMEFTGSTTVVLTIQGNNFNVNLTTGEVTAA